MTEKEQIEQLTEALLRYVAVYGKTQLQADGLRTTAELMSRFGIVALPENSVVLTKAEKKELLHEMYEQGKFDAMELKYSAGFAFGSRETAKQIYITGKYYYAKHSPTERQLSDFLAHIKETYDVGVE